MNENLKPLFEQLKQTLSNREQLREKMVENITKTRAAVEEQAKVLVQQTKDSKVMNDYVIPLLQSEKTEQALKSLNMRLGQLPILEKIEKMRSDLIETKTAKAQAAAEPTSTEVPVQTAATEAVAAESEKTESATKTRKSKSSEKKDA